MSPGREKPLRELSTGQKGTVIIALAMAQGTGPLIIDQPEEPLDTESIYGQVVRTLRRAKDGRQFIFTTHNANIAVGADADLSHILNADADTGRIVSSGGVDDLETNRLLLIQPRGGTRRSRPSHSEVRQRRLTVFAHISTTHPDLPNRGSSARLAGSAPSASRTRGRTAALLLLWVGVFREGDPLPT